MALNRGFLFAVLVMVAAAQLVGNASAATYIVGDSLGWTVPNTPTAYATWASQHVFRVGDVLVFNFSTGLHDVAHVTRAAFDGCSSNNPIALVTLGPANVTVNSTGENYYICTFGSHCSLGQKLAINVSAASPTTPPPAPAPSPPTTPTPAPTPPPSRSPSPSPSPSRPPSPSGAPSPSPSGAPSPGSKSPSPTPGGSATPPPSPASESTPGVPPSPSVPGGSLSPPPPPSSATIASISAPLVIFASVAFGLVI